MALRKTILANGEVYHVFNRSIHGIPIFKGKREYELFTETIKYYLQPKPPTKFSRYRISRDKYPIKFRQKLVRIVNYCLMPNHFHFTLKQEKNDGIKNFIQRLSNSFAHYFNIKNESKGPVFEGSFKSAHIENDEQLIHLSRYIHLNPVSAYLVEDPEDYSYSSYNAYLGKEKTDFIDPSLVIGFFSSPSDYQKFVLAQKNYQRELVKIKHLLLE